MVIDIKMCRFDNVPWGFRLVGGSDFQYPLTVVKVHEGSIAEEAGLREADVIVRINDTATSPLTHDEVNKIIKHCGNVFYFGVYREVDDTTISAPKQFPLHDETERPGATPDSFLEVGSSCKSPMSSVALSEEPEYLPDSTELADRPCSVLSEATEIKLVEQEIAAVLSGESEVLKDHNIMGIFPKPGVCMSSDVLRTLNAEAIKTKAEKDKENKKWTTFLQKPNRPIPKSKQQVEAERRAANAYKVKIVRNAPRSERSVSPAVQKIESEKIVEPEPEPTPAAEPEPLTPAEPEAEEPPPTDSEVPNLEETQTLPDDNERDRIQVEDDDVEMAEEKIDQEKAVGVDNKEEVEHEHTDKDKNKDVVEGRSAHVTTAGDSNGNSKQAVAKTEEELALERQLTDVQRQLAALSSLPSTIQATLDAVTKQLAELLPTFKLQQQPTTALAVAVPREISLHKIDEDAADEADGTATRTPDTEVAHDTPDGTPTETNCDGNINEDDNGGLRATNDKAPPIEQNEAPAEEHQQQAESAELMNGHDRRHERQEQDLTNMKKHKSHDVIEELADHLERKNNPKRSKRAFGPLTPSSERPLVLPGGRRWYRPKDAYNDEFIAETLSAQAELISGSTLGCTYESPLLGYDSSEYHSACVAKQLERQRVNFMKYQKPERKIDLNRSEVYKVIHHLDRQPVRGIEVRPPVVPAEVDIRRAIES